MEQLKEMLFQLCSAAGTPGDEHFAALQAKKALEPYCTCLLYTSSVLYLWY